MRVVAIYNRNIQRAVDAYTYVSDELQPVIATTQAASTKPSAESSRSLRKTLSCWHAQNR